MALAFYPPVKLIQLFFNPDLDNKIIVD